MSSSLSDGGDADSSLRLRLLHFLPSVPPVTASTRDVLRRKLAEVMHGERMNDCKVTNGGDASASTPPNSLRPVMTTTSPPPPPATSQVSSPLASLVFFDLEATGLSSSGHPRTRVTELSMVSVDPMAFHAFQKELVRWRAQGKGEGVLLEELVPRVTNRLTLCFQPAAHVTYNVAQLTGLDNHNLQTQHYFDRASADLIQSFLGHLAGPVCLVAHNGARYDIPLLKSEMEAAGTNLAEDLLFVDSLEGLKQIYKLEAEYQKRVTSEDDDVLCRPIDGVMNEEEEEEDTFDISPKPEKDNAAAAVLLGDIGEDSSSDPREENECTPDKNSTASATGAAAAPGRPRKRRQQRIPSGETGAAARKRLDFTKPQSYSLASVHEHMFGVRPRVSHGAEQDCLALMRVCAMKRQAFLEFASSNKQRTIASIAKMW